MKQPDRPADDRACAGGGEELEAGIRRQASDGRISCAELRRLAERLGTSYADAGAAAAAAGVRVHDCGLGLFGGPAPGARRRARPEPPPVISVVGRSKSGKTTLLEGVVASLVRRGRRVGVAKHHAHRTEIDVPGKDTWRFTQAGAAVSIISGPDRVGVIRRVERERTLEELLALAGEVDLLLTEGFRGSSPVRIEVIRSERSREPLSEPHELSALATDIEGLRHGTVPVFELNDVEGVADFIEAIAFGSPGDAGNETAPAGVPGLGARQPEGGPGHGCRQEQP